MKLKEIIFSAMILNCMIFISCNSTSHSDFDPTLPRFSIEQPLPQLPQSDSISIVNNPKQSEDIIAYNPPHGQPGHDCSIAVGAPLNRPAPTNSVQNIMTTPAPVSTARLNPPHGQPGHRCEIPVGQPLP